jgi:hypothetical protein
MVYDDLDEVTGEMRSTAQQNLRPMIEHAYREWRPRKRATYIENLLGNKFPPSERPVQGLNGTVPGEEVVGTDIGISWKSIEASAHKYERWGVVYLIEDDLKDFIYSEPKEMSAIASCGTTTATHRQDGPYSVKLG